MQLGKGCVFMSCTHLHLNKFFASYTQYTIPFPSLTIKTHCNTWNSKSFDDLNQSSYSGVQAPDHTIQEV